MTPKDLREDRLLSFRLTWQDAWHYIDNGIDTDFYHSAEGVAKIDFLVKKQCFTVDLNGREQEFIDDIRKLNIVSIDDQEFMGNAVDGFLWFLRIRTTNYDICSGGLDSYPQEVVDLIQYLHRKWGIPYPFNINLLNKYYLYPQPGHKRHKLELYNRNDIGPISRLRE